MNGYSYRDCTPQRCLVTAMCWMCSPRTDGWLYMVSAVATNDPCWAHAHHVRACWILQRLQQMRGQLVYIPWWHHRCCLSRKRNLSRSRIAAPFARHSGVPAAPPGPRTCCDPLVAGACIAQLTIVTIRLHPVGSILWRALGHAEWQVLERVCWRSAAARACSDDHPARRLSHAAMAAIESHCRTSLTALHALHVAVGGGVAFHVGLRDGASASSTRSCRDSERLDGNVMPACHLNWLTLSAIICMDPHACLLLEDVLCYTVMGAW